MLAKEIVTEAMIEDMIEIAGIAHILCWTWVCWQQDAMPELAAEAMCAIAIAIVTGAIESGGIADHAQGETPV